MGKLKGMSACPMDCIRSFRFVASSGDLFSECPNESEEYAECYYAQNPEKLLNVVKILKETISENSKTQKLEFLYTYVPTKVPIKQEVKEAEV
jgi:hypothetical protein